MAIGWRHLAEHILPAKLASPASQRFDGRLSRLEWYRDIDLAVSEADTIESQLRELGVAVKPFWLDVSEVADFINRFSDAVPWTDPDTLPDDIAELQTILRTEKLIEFYISTKLMKLRTGNAIVDIGSAESGFVRSIAREYDLEGHAVDPALAGLTSPEKIFYHPCKISEACSQLPKASLITLHCAFEMFEPPEMRSVIEVAKEKLLPGGALIISPLYLRTRRTVYVDDQRTPEKFNLLFGGHPAQILGIKDYWNLTWSEWLSPKALKDRLASELDGLEFTVLRIMNPHAILPGCFIRFTGVWRRP